MDPSLFSTTKNVALIFFLRNKFKKKKLLEVELSFKRASGL